MPPAIEPIYADLGRRIQRRRLERRMTQEQLGAQLVPPVTRASIANIETGKQRVLVHTLIRVAELFEVELAGLLPGQGSSQVAASPATIQRELQRKLELPRRAVKALAKQLDLDDRPRRVGTSQTMRARKSK